MIVMGTYLFYTGIYTLFVCPNVLIFYNTLLYVKFKNNPYAIRLNIHMREEKILNIEPMEDQRTVYSLESYRIKERKYFYY